MLTSSEIESLENLSREGKKLPSEKDELQRQLLKARANMRRLLAEYKGSQVQVQRLQKDVEFIQKDNAELLSQNRALRFKQVA